VPTTTLVPSGGTGQPGLVKRALEGSLPGNLSRDDILDNVTLYWLTNTGVSSARLYRENKADFFDAKKISIPFAISVLPDELYQAPRSWAERAYPPSSSITTCWIEAATSPTGSSQSYLQPNCERRSGHCVDLYHTGGCRPMVTSMRAALGGRAPSPLRGRPFTLDGRGGGARPVAPATPPRARKVAHRMTTILKVGARI
jgi:hypothetical protein